MFAMTLRCDVGPKSAGRFEDTPLTMRHTHLTLSLPETRPVIEDTTVLLAL
jgi:hypothetical protein